MTGGERLKKGVFFFFFFSIHPPFYPCLLWTVILLDTRHPRASFISITITPAQLPLLPLPPLPPLPLYRYLQLYRQLPLSVITLTFQHSNY